jgi:hypothetical protein
MKLTHDSLDTRQTQKHQQLASSNEQITNQSINSTPSLTHSLDLVSNYKTHICIFNISLLYFVIT